MRKLVERLEKLSRNHSGRILSESDAKFIINKILHGIKIPSNKQLSDFSNKELSSIIQQLAEKGLPTLRKMQDGIRQAANINYKSATVAGTMRDPKAQLSMEMENIHVLEKCLDDAVRSLL